MAALAALLCGCATEHYVTDARHPEISITEAGGVTYRGEFVDIEDLPGLLKDSGFRKRDARRTAQAAATPAISRVDRASASPPSHTLQMNSDS